MGIIKGIVHQKMEIVSLFTHFHLISNLYAIIFSEEHAGGGFGGMYHETLQHETTVDLKFFLSFSESFGHLLWCFLCHFGARQLQSSYTSVVLNILKGTYCALYLKSLFCVYGLLEDFHT